MNILKDNSIVHSIGKSYELSSSDQPKRNQPYQNCKTVCISPERPPKVTTNIPDTLVSDTDLLPESSISLHVAAVTSGQRTSGHFGAFIVNLYLIVSELLSRSLVINICKYIQTFRVLFLNVL